MQAPQRRLAHHGSTLMRLPGVLPAACKYVLESKGPLQLTKAALLYGCLLPFPTVQHEGTGSIIIAMT